MQEYQSQDIGELSKALLAVQRQLQPATKDGNNPFTKSTYATLNSVMEACRECLHSNSIWLTQLPMPTPPHIGSGHLGLMTKLTHTPSGQWQSSFIIAPLPKNDPQGMGSALTYCRRYALTAMLGIVTEDDDGEAAKIPSKRATPQKQARNAPVTQNVNQDMSHIERDQTQPSNPPYQHNNFSSLPHIDGVTYQHVTAQDGRPCVVASGNTQAKRELLKGAGFQWNAQRKMWWKYADAS